MRDKLFQNLGNILDCDNILPEQRLLIGVIRQAVFDYFTHKNFEIVGWFRNGDNSPMSFLYCLEHILSEDTDILEFREIFLRKLGIIGNEKFEYQKYQLVA